MLNFTLSAGGQRSLLHGEKEVLARPAGLIPTVVPGLAGQGLVTGLVRLFH